MHRHGRGCYPGPRAREKRWSYVFLGAAVPLFLTGVTLAYWSLGRSMHYLLGLTPQHVSNLIQVDQYMSFVMTMLLAFGIAFEVPLLIIMLNLASLLPHERFRKWRRVIALDRFLDGDAGVCDLSLPKLLVLAVLALSGDLFGCGHGLEKVRRDRSVGLSVGWRWQSPYCWLWPACLPVLPPLGEHMPADLAASAGWW